MPKKGISRNDWETPHDLFKALNDVFNFTLDVCASKQNAKCERFFTEKEDGLKQAWAPNVCWMNPPYSADGVGVVGEWLAKARYEVEQKGATVVAIVVNDPSTRWWMNHMMRAVEVVVLLGPRVRFIGSTSSPTFTNVIAVFKPAPAGTRGKGTYWDWRNTPWPYGAAVV